MTSDAMRNQKKRPTLRTIAQLSGLAVTTVSRALGDAPDISAETKQLVRKIAADLGYVPDRAGVRLRTGRTNVIALIVPMEEDALNMTSRFVSAIAGALSETRYHLVVVPEMPGQTLLDPVRYVVETRSADSVIFNRVQPQDPRVAYLLERGFPFASHGRSDWHADHAWFDYDNAGFGHRAMSYLAARGRRRIVLITPPLTQTYGREMRDSAAAVASQQGMVLVEPDGLTSDTARADIETTMRGVLSKHPRPDGVVVASPNAALAVIRAIRQADMAIGQHIDVFAKETFPILDVFSQDLKIEHEDVRKAGAFLARAVLHEISASGGSHMQHIDICAQTPASD
ncbi:MAG: LacI family DNA-binding transcriptional regulator [Rhodobacteraceae bacterium]|nr:MAG: LacI family DNA-binding transcriptional regulator [Paracoccaceae bacterium]